MLRTKLLPLGWLTLAFLVTYRDGDGSDLTKREGGFTEARTKSWVKEDSRKAKRWTSALGAATLGPRHGAGGERREARPRSSFGKPVPLRPPRNALPVPSIFNYFPMHTCLYRAPPPQPQPPPPLVFLPPSLSLLLHFAHTSLTGAPSVSHIRVPLASPAAFNKV